MNNNVYLIHEEDYIRHIDEKVMLYSFVKQLTHHIGRMKPTRANENLIKTAKCYEEKIQGSGAQLVIYGKKGHAEVNGLVGQTEGNAIVIERKEDLDRLDFHRPIYLFSQTTKSLDGFQAIVAEIKSRMAEGIVFEYYDTICRQVANRLPNIKAFASNHDWVYFVAGKKSSNGKMLFEECRKANPNTYFISEANEIDSPLPEHVKKVGVCGATSTPKWLMEEVAERIKSVNKSEL